MEIIVYKQSETYSIHSVSLPYVPWLEAVVLLLQALRMPAQQGTIYNQYRNLGGTLAYHDFSTVRQSVMNIYNV